MNPFDTTYNYIPFDRIKETDYEPAMMKGIEEEDQEIDKICGRLLMQNHENVLAMQYMLLYPLLENNYNKFVQYMHLVRNEVPYSQEFVSFEKYLRKQ